MQSFDNAKDLRFVITLGVGKFGSSNANTITLQGFRATAEIDKAGGMMMGQLRAQIFGVSESDMNQITTLQWKTTGQLIPNTIDVYAIDGPQETLIFAGNIVNAWPNYQTMPDVFLMIQAQAAFHAQITPVPPTSFKGSVDVATLMSQLANQMGFTFENNGVSVLLTNPYLPNTAMEQAKALAQAANVDLYLDDKVLAITPPRTPRKLPVPEISASTGLRGYPTFDGIGVHFETLFNPAIRFGGSVNLVTSVKAITNVSSQWIVVSVAHRLQVNNPGGAWFSTVRGNPSGLAIVD